MTAILPAPARASGAVSSSAGAAQAAFEDLARRVRPAVEARLRVTLDEAVASARALGPAVEAVVEALRSLSLRGGKRWRAVLLAGAYEGCGGEGGAERVVMACLAFELLQAYLLVHDDWMDGDRTRRGGPSVHAALADHFASESLGAASAVLAGDYASALAQEALLAVPAAPACLLDAAREFARVQREVTLGQMIDLVGGAAASIDVTYTLKTSSYTVRGPLLLGAALAGAPAATRAALERHARPLGIAFQLRDDLLGAFGDPAVTGKPVGADLRRGKRTALVVEMEKDPHGSHLLERVLGVNDAPEEEVLAVGRRMVESGARARVEARVTALLDEAMGALDDQAVPPALCHVLTGAAVALGHRER
jgi:geranylgeranyl diphosphate synthase type I